jgi:pyrroloquinoline quinone biosynthesis protein E
MGIAGDAAATDPACVKSPVHARMAMLIMDGLANGETSAKNGNADNAFVYRRIAATQPA